MQLELIRNPDESQIAVYKVARVIYAETGASSLPVVEALASMIANLSAKSGRSVCDIAGDDEIFESLKSNSVRHEYLCADAAARGMQMCVRVARRMMRGGIPDTCRGATMFHRADTMPEWAVSRGYIADIDGLLFYL